MKNAFAIAALLLVFIPAGWSQGTAKPEVSSDITGLYSFLHEGEFVQIEVEEGKVSGLVSRFKNEDLEKAEFVDQYFDQAKLDGSTLSFRTKPADGDWLEFSGKVERGPGKIPGDEAYWTVKGTLTEHTKKEGKIVAKAQELTLKSFPKDEAPNAIPK